MNALQRLDQYLAQVRGRLRRVVVARGAAAISLTTLAITCVAVWLLQRQGYPHTVLIAARILLPVAWVFCIAALLWRPLRALHAHHGAGELERHLPAQQGRIRTYLDAIDRHRSSPLLPLLAQDALAVAERSPPDVSVPRARVMIPAAFGAVAALVLLALLVSNSDWSFTTRYLWLGAALPAKQLVARQLSVRPGDATLRKNQDLVIKASARGFTPKEAILYVRFGAAHQWERARMQPAQDGNFEFTLYAVREPLNYYVTAHDVSSTQHRIAVVDLPRIERMRLTYHYPQWTGLTPVTDEESREIRAVAGTEVQLDVHTSAPLDHATLVVNGEAAPLMSDGTSSTGTITVQKAGHYRLSARVGNELAPLTEDYDITVVDDRKPSIEVVKPGRDYQASGIEEVPVHLSAADDFKLRALELRYAVNGGEWQTVKLPANSKQADTQMLLRLEELGKAHGASGLTPGDLVTYYAVAHDEHQSAQTDLFLIQVQPFDRRYTQSQSAGQQGGGAGEQDAAISDRQREILLATWNLERSREDPGARGAQRIQDNARMLAQLQTTLGEQARTLIERSRMRLLTDADERIRSFIENLQQAAQAMQPAVTSLNELKLKQAIPDEQKALQHLLRAEALFSDIQVAFQNSRNGGSSGGQAGRDLKEMFEMEMDLDKNQYETESQASAEAPQQDLDETLRKLRELAQRQEKLAREAPSATPKEQRWQQQQLQREAEELRQRLAELSKRENASQQRGGNARSASNTGNSSIEAALNQADKALRDMRSESSSNAGGQSSNSPSTQASKQLKQALEQIDRQRRQGRSNMFDDFAQRAGQLANAQQRSADELQSALAEARKGKRSATRDQSDSELSQQRAQQFADEKRKLQSQLQALEGDMQRALQQRHDNTPKARERLSEATKELAEANPGNRLARSALELDRGFELQAATSDGLITESLQTLQRDLDAIAQLARSESQEAPQDNARPEQLLSELGELRRALQEGGQVAQENGQAAEEGGQATNAAGGASSGGVGGPQTGYAGHFIEGDRGRLNAWNPPLVGNAGQRAASPQLQHDAQAIAQRLRELQSRLPPGSLRTPDIAALKELADRLRRGDLDPMESQYARMRALVDQLELAALSAADKANPQALTRALTPETETPEYRANVADYYRRLGTDGAAQK